MLVTCTEEKCDGYIVTEEVEVITYDDCIAMMDAAIALRLTEEDEQATLAEYSPQQDICPASFTNPEGF